MTVLGKYGTDAPLFMLPRVLQVGIPLLGTQEVLGRGSNRTIMAWRDALNQAAGIVKNAQPINGFSDDDIPWCGLFAAYVWFKAGKPVVKNPLWARNWAHAGEPVAARVKDKLVFEKGKRASLGDRLVFVRPGGGGHVGDYICESATHYAVLGGNQTNSVTITKIAKNRCIAVRRPPMKIPPKTMQPVIVKSFPGTTSVNEA